jgi:hypothetical protein
VLRAPGRSCHDRQAGCRFLRAGSAYDRLRISGRARSGAPCVTATRRSPLGAPPWRFLGRTALCLLGSPFGLVRRPPVIATGHMTRRTATRASRGSVASRHHAGLPHPTPPNRTASGRCPSWVGLIRYVVCIPNEVKIKCKLGVKNVGRARTPSGAAASGRASPATTRSSARPRGRTGRTSGR